MHLPASFMLGLDVPRRALKKIHLRFFFLKYVTLCMITQRKNLGITLRVSLDWK